MPAAVSLTAAPDQLSVPPAPPTIWALRANGAAALSRQIGATGSMLTTTSGQAAAAQLCVSTSGPQGEPSSKNVSSSATASSGARPAKKADVSVAAVSTWPVGTLSPTESAPAGKAHAKESVTGVASQVTDTVSSGAHTCTLCAKGVELQPASVTTSVTACTPASVHTTRCGPAPVPGTAMPPSKSHAKAAFAEAEPMKVTTAVSPAHTSGVSAKSAVG